MALDATEVADNLSIGSHPEKGSVTKEDFDVLILVAKEHQEEGLAGPGVQVFKTSPGLRDNERNDDPIPFRQVASAHAAATRAAKLAKKGERVLITCNEGKNRSAFVAALAMMMMGDESANDVIDHIRDVRDEDALNNESFAIALRHFHHG